MLFIYIYIYIYTHIHTCIYIHTHTCIYIHIHIYIIWLPYDHIESVLCTSITVWFSSATKSDLRRLRRAVRTAKRIIGTTLPALQELYLSRVSKRAGKITRDPSYPHFLFELLPSGRRYRALSTRTTRHRNSFFPQASHEHLRLNVEHTHHYYTIIYLPQILII